MSLAIQALLSDGSSNSLGNILWCLSCLWGHFPQHVINQDETHPFLALMVQDVHLGNCLLNYIVNQSKFLLYVCILENISSTT